MAQPIRMYWSSNYIPTYMGIGPTNALSMVLHFQLQRSRRFDIFPMQHDFKQIRYVLSKSYTVLLSNHWLTTIDSRSSSKLVKLLLEAQLMLLMQLLLPLPDLHVPPQSLHRDGFGNCLSWQCLKVFSSHHRFPNSQSLFCTGEHVLQPYTLKHKWMLWKLWWQGKIQHDIWTSQTS